MKFHFVLLVALEAAAETEDRKISLKIDIKYKQGSK